MGDSGDPVSEGSVKDDCLRIGVVEEVPELFVEVSVVDVDRHAAHLEHAVVGLHVLIRVVHEQGDLRVGAKPGGGERLRHSCASVVVLGPCSGCVAGRDGRGVGNDVGD